MRPINEIIVHSSATNPDMQIGVEEIRQWHMAKGWSDVGYHYVIRRNGKVEKGRDLETAGAHVKGHNAQSIGICLVGGISESGKSEANFTIHQYIELAQLLNYLKHIYPTAEILGHKDVPEVSKDCPCFNVRALMEIN